MADGKDINKKLCEIFIANSNINNIVNSRVYYGEAHPVGNEFPQIVVHYKPGESEEIFPAMHGTLCIYIFGKKMREDTGVVAQVKQLMKYIHLLINRNESEPLNDIDLDDNEGLRVVQCNRLSANDEENQQNNRYYGEMNYKITMSDNEDFETDGGATWVE